MTSPLVMERIHNSRSRFWLGVGILLVMPLGLASRKFPFLFPPILGKYPGDALWTLMVFLGWALLKPSASTMRFALFALSTSYVVEFSQIYQAPWINALRNNPAVHLVLGSTFSWFDLCAYTIGAAVGVALDCSILVRIKI